MIRTFFLITAFLVSSTASATLWSIDGVLHNNGGGFTYSLLHLAHPNPMTANGAATIKIDSASGHYNDSTGDLHLLMGIEGGGSLLLEDLASNKPSIVPSTGLLELDSTVKYTFSDFGGGPYPYGADETGNIGIKAGVVCCNGNNPPNSLRDGSGNYTGVGLHYLTLWAANLDGIYSSSTGYGNGTVFGMDLKLELNPVPVPAAVWLFGTALLGLFGWQRRKASA